MGIEEIKMAFEISLKVLENLNAIEEIIGTDERLEWENKDEQETLEYVVMPIIEGLKTLIIDIEERAKETEGPRGCPEGHKGGNER
jgi:hypothetical protein